jgi:hypothetical protein
MLPASTSHTTRRQKNSRLLETRPFDVSDICTRVDVFMTLGANDFRLGIKRSSCVQRMLLNLDAAARHKAQDDSKRAKKHLFIGTGTQQPQAHKSVALSTGKSRSCYSIVCRIYPRGGRFFT